MSWRTKRKSNSNILNWDTLRRDLSNIFEPKTLEKGWFSNIAEEEENKKYENSKCFMDATNCVAIIIHDEELRKWFEFNFNARKTNEISLEYEMTDFKEKKLFLDSNALLNIVKIFASQKESFALKVKVDFPATFSLSKNSTHYFDIILAPRVDTE